MYTFSCLYQNTIFWRTLIVIVLFFFFGVPCPPVPRRNWPPESNFKIHWPVVYSIQQCRRTRNKVSSPVHFTLWMTNFVYKLYNHRSESSDMIRNSQCLFLRLQLDVLLDVLFQGWLLHACFHSFVCPNRISDFLSWCLELSLILKMECCLSLSKLINSKF